MRRWSRSLVLVGLVCGLTGATTLTAAAQAVGQLDFTVYVCSTTDDDLAGGSEFIAGFTGDELDCLESAPADGVTVTVYDAATDTPLATATTADGSAHLAVDVTASPTFYVGEDFNDTESAVFTVDEQAGAIVTIVLFVDADGEVEIAARDRSAASGDPVAGAGFTVYEPDCTTAVAGEVLTDERGLARFGDLLAGTYCVRETTVPDGYRPAPAPIEVTVVAGQTAAIAVTNEPEPPGEATVAAAQEAGQVLVSAVACAGIESAVEIDVRGPAIPGKHAAPGPADDESCTPIDGLGFRVFLFGAEGADPIAGSTDEQGTVLLVAVPPTDEVTGPHLFRTVVGDGAVEADFDVAVDGITAITVVVFAPVEAPTATAIAGATSSAASTGTGSVSTLPGTGTGTVPGSAGVTAWPLVSILALIALAAAGYARHRRAT